MRSRGEVVGSQPMSTAVHRSPYKLWRSNSIYYLWFLLSDKHMFFVFCSHWPGEADGGEAVRRDSHLRDMEDNEVQQPRDPRQDGAGDGHQAGEGEAAYRAAWNVNKERDAGDYVLGWRELREHSHTMQRNNQGRTISGPCWLLKLRWMGTQRGQMKGILSWLVCWAGRADTRDFCSTLAALVGPVLTKYFFPHRTLFHFLCPHRPASWAGSRAGLSLSVCLWIPSYPFLNSIPASSDKEEFESRQMKQCWIQELVVFRWFLGFDYGSTGSARSPLILVIGLFSSVSFWMKRNNWPWQDVTA